jgi:glucose/arabinose dehydrogenase
VAANEVTTGLDRPWGVAFTPDGRTFVTEQDSGRVLELTDGGELSEVQALEVAPQGEGGLLGLAASPDYADDGLLYAYLSTDSDNRVVRFRPGESPEPVLTGVPHGRIHNGGRIAFGPDGMLYVGTGDAGTGSRAQDPGSLAGKILRINPDGTVPADNRFDSPVYSLGHRNVQGLAWDADRQLYASEFGPDADDEINRITAGGNYGWPEVTGMTDGDDFIDPTYVRQPPGASWSGIALSARPAVPRWAGDLLIASLRGQRLWRLELGDDGAVTDAEELLVDEYGRLRTATFAPDGSLWLMTSNTDIYGDPQPGDDRIVRLAPAE